MTLDVSRIRADFPILDREVRPGVKLVYLDSTATTQKPSVVIEAMDDFYRRSNANIHRGVHTLAEEATAMYEQARQVVANFIHSPSAEQVIFTRNATESLTLHAYTIWRALDIGGSAAVAYLLLFTSTFFCIAFANLVRQRFVEG